MLNAAALNWRTLLLAASTMPWMGKSSGLQVQADADVAWLDRIRRPWVARAQQSSQAAVASRDRHTAATELRPIGGALGELDPPRALPA